MNYFITPHNKIVHTTLEVKYSACGVSDEKHREWLTAIIKDFIKTMPRMSTLQQTRVYQCSCSRGEAAGGSGVVRTQPNITSETLDQVSFLFCFPKTLVLMNIQRLCWVNTLARFNSHTFNFDPVYTRLQHRSRLLGLAF